MKWSKQGGKRSAAGAPKKYGDRVSVTVRLSIPAKKRLDSLYGSQSAIIERLLLTTYQTKNK